MSAGERGSTGEAGVAGRQGEAGVSGPQGETGAVGRVGDAGRSGPRGPRGVAFSQTQLLVAFLFVILAFTVVTIRTEVQQRQINHNAQRIEHNAQRLEQVLVENARIQYTICTDRNTAVQRQNALIDSAIAAEKRKPEPDAKRIRDLTAFRGAVPNCGPKPPG